MSLKNDIPMKIHVARAKDLPLSWYELILRPNKFTEHLETLRHNPEGKSLICNSLYNASSCMGKSSKIA